MLWWKWPFYTAMWLLGRETVCGLQHVLQHLDLVAGFAELLLQAVVGLLQIEGVVLQQRDALSQLALAGAGRRAEDPGDNLVCGSVVCHWSTSSSPAEFNQRFFNHGVAAG